MAADPIDSRPPVVLLHGSAFSGAQWRALADRLSDRYRILAPDLCGYGTSGGWAGRGAFHLAHEAQAVLADLGGLEEPVHLVGHSYGGAVALHLARTRPGMTGRATNSPCALVTHGARSACGDGASSGASALPPEVTAREAAPGAGIGGTGPGITPSSPTARSCATRKATRRAP